MNSPILIKVGPRGGHRQKRCSTWDECGYTNIKQIFISHGDSINSIQIAYDRGGRVTLLEKHGGEDEAAKFDVVTVSESDPLLELSGYYGKCPKRSKGTVIRSLKFITSSKTYGPYGCEQGNPFSFNISSDEFGGFHGQSSASFLRSIGIYVKTLATTYGGKGMMPRLPWV